MLLFCLCLTAAWGQSTGPEKAKQIVDEAIAALGGEAFLRMQDRIETGRAYSFTNERLAGLTVAKISTRYLTRPEPPLPGFYGQRERQVLGKDGTVYNIYNEEGAYEVSYRGAKPFPADITERSRESLFHNILYILRMRLGEPGMGMDYRGADVVENQPMEVVELWDNENRTVTVWFHRSEKLPFKQMWSRRHPLSREKVDEVTVFAKYRDVGGGVKWPYVIRRERNGERIFEMYSESVVVNQGLDDSLFTLSGETKILDRTSDGKRIEKTQKPQ